MSKLNYELLNQVKRAFVEQPGGMPPPGMDPAMMGGGMPPPGMDPAMMGGMPPPGMDPAMMGGGMPPPGMDPAMAGLTGAPAESASQNSMISMTTDEFMKFIKQLVALITNAAKGNAESTPTVSGGQDSAKLDQILGMLNGLR